MTEIWERAFLHCDMDAFFAAVEQLDFPELRGKPVVVGGDPGTRSVVCACSYEAKLYNIKSGMASRMVYDICPQAIFRRARYKRYVEISEKLMDIMRIFTPLVEPISIDEAFADISGSQRIFGSPEKIAQSIKETVLAETGLTVSVGAAQCKFVAKMGSSTNKPDGLTVVPPGREKEFLAPIKIGKMWGVGKATEARLHADRIFTIGDLSEASLDSLFRRFGKCGRQLFLLSNGIDFRGVERGILPRSVTNSTTLHKNTTSYELLNSHLLYLSHLVGFRLRQAKIAGSTAILKGKWEGRIGFTRNLKLAFPTDIDEDIYHAGVELLKKEPLIRPLRHIGIGITNICHTPDPYLLNEPQKRRRLNKAFDIIEQKYGDGIVTKLGILQHVEHPRANHPFAFFDKLKKNVEKKDT